MCSSLQSLLRGYSELLRGVGQMYAQLTGNIGLSHGAISSLLPHETMLRCYDQWLDRTGCHLSRKLGPGELTHPPSRHLFVCSGLLSPVCFKCHRPQTLWLKVNLRNGAIPSPTHVSCKPCFCLCRQHSVRTEWRFVFFYK